jgi:hypothetical protein
MKNFDNLKYEVLKFELDVPLKKVGIEFMLYDFLRQLEEPEIKMEDWDAYIMNKL